MTAPSYKDFVAKLGNEADAPEAPALPFEQQEQQPLDATPKGGPVGTESALGPKLEKIAGRSLDKADEILELPLDPDNAATYGPTLRAQTAVVGHAIGTQVRVDENKLREQRFDRLPELMRKIAEVQAQAAQFEKGGDDGGP